MLWESIAEENCDIAMDCSSFQLPVNHSTSGGRSSRRLNLNGASLHEMAIDELSFYNDDEDSRSSSSSTSEQMLLLQQQRQHTYNASPQLMGLLSPEGSPQRFQIIENPAIASEMNKFLPPLVRQQKLPNTNGTSCSASSTTCSSNINSTNSSNTPAKSFRIFHSLSSGSMESSIDDEYMELFEMESFEQQQCDPQSLLNFPSNLNSLISGQIKSSSPAVSATVTNNSSAVEFKPLEMRRPSVRRCLSMTENQTNLYQQQPKTPELIKQIQETVNNNTSTTTPFAARLMAERCNSTTPSSTVTSSSSSANWCFKRPEPPSTTSSPVLTKRYRGAEKENLDGSFTETSPTIINVAAANNTINATATITRPVPLRKSMSMNDAEIMSALARSESIGEPDLIGDFSKPYALPLMDGRHRDLKSISSDTVARLLNGDFQNQVANYKIIDCRYPYEFEGGHIRGAKNLYTQEQIMNEFLTNIQKTEPQQEQTNASGNRRNIIIFHCEFSSERGPKLSRFLRNSDRAVNTNAYPVLDYPEIYLLHNGYKDFYETHSELCDPIAYRPMLEPSYNEAYRHFRAKSKSWNGDGLGGATSRMKKSRSRLML